MSDPISDLIEEVEKTEKQKKQAVPAGPKPKPKKPPLRKVDCGGFSYVRDDQKFWPHQDEWVIVKAGMSLSSFVTTIRLQAIGKVDWGRMTEAEYLMVKEGLAGTWQALEGVIVKWNWTDDVGEPYPEKPTAKDLERLSPEETFYLVGIAMGGDGREEEDLGEE